jgi:hypothetical protein
MVQKHPEDEACKTRTEHYGDNIPLPADHSNEGNGADEDGEGIRRAITWKITCKPIQTARFSTTPTTDVVTADNVVVNASLPRNFSM